MRWIEPDLGKTRMVTGFLFWPKTLYGETRWLEVASWWQQYSATKFKNRWLDVNFVNIDPIPNPPF